MRPSSPLVMMMTTIVRKSFSNCLNLSPLANIMGYLALAYQEELVQARSCVDNASFEENLKVAQ